MADPDSSDSGSNWGKYAGLGFEIAVGVVGGYLVGSWADRHFGWKSSVGTLGGVFLGLAAGMYLLIRDAIRMNKD